MSENKNDPFLNKETFKNRRRMAYISIFCIAVYLFVAPLIYPVAMIIAFKDISIFIIGAFVAVVMTYMGTTTASAGIVHYFNAKMNNNSSQPQPQPESEKDPTDKKPKG